MKKVLSLSIVVFSLLCCTREETQRQTAQQMKLSSTISVDEALDNMNAFLNVVNTKNGTRVSNKQIANIWVAGQDAVTRGETRSDSILYIVNFENDRGFAILAADERIPDPVIAYAESGNLNSWTPTLIPDTIQDPLLNGKYFLDEDDYYAGANNMNAFINDLVIKNIEEKLWTVDGDNDKQEERELLYSSYGKRVLSTSVTYDTIVGAQRGPLVYNKWHQNEPFYNKTPWQGLRPKTRAPAGCVAVALGQLMATNQKPINPTFNGNPCNWATINSVCNSTNYEDYYYVPSDAGISQVTDLMIDIGKHENAWMHYYKEYSYATATGAARALRNYGYTNVHKYLGYSDNESRIYSMLNNNKPVFILAFDKRTGCENAHAWLIDGYRNLNCNRNITYQLADGTTELYTITRTTKYMHCNWGWRGHGDGYYSAGVFNLSKREDYDPDMDSQTEGDNSLNHTWWFRIVTYNLPQ